MRLFVWLTSKAVFNWPAWYKSKNCIRSSNKKNVFILLWLAVLPRVLYLKKKEMWTSWHKIHYFDNFNDIQYTHWFSVDNKTKIPRFRAWIHKSQKNGQKAIQISRHCLSFSCSFCINMRQWHLFENFPMAFISNSVFRQLTSVTTTIFAIWFICAIECVTKVKRQQYGNLQ